MEINTKSKHNPISICPASLELKNPIITLISNDEKITFIFSDQSVYLSVNLLNNDIINYYSFSLVTGLYHYNDIENFYKNHYRDSNIKMEISGNFYCNSQVKSHRKRRINKKWQKRYGYQLKPFPILGKILDLTIDREIYHEFPYDRQYLKFIGNVDDLHYS